MPDISQLQKSIDINFKNASLLELAITHSSYINEKPGIALASNERLEFVGDAVLGLVIGEKLFKDCPGSPEGELTRLRAALVRKEKLASLALNINLGDYLFLGKGEESGGGRSKIANLAGAFESIIAAIYFDQGLDIARNFILKVYGPEIEKQGDIGASTDYKSKLQEIIQAQRQITPSYQIVEAVGPDHDRQFTIEVKAGSTVLGRGIGKSKKAAEMEAARDAIQKLS